MMMVVVKKFNYVQNKKKRITFLYYCKLKTRREIGVVINKNFIMNSPIIRNNNNKKKDIKYRVMINLE